MTASDKCTNQIKKDLLCRSHPHTTFAAPLAVVDVSRADNADLSPDYLSDRLSSTDGIAALGLRSFTPVDELNCAWFFT